MWDVHVAAVTDRVIANDILMLCWWRNLISDLLSFVLHRRMYFLLDVHAMLVFDEVLSGGVDFVLIQASCELSHGLKHFLLRLWEVATHIFTIIVEHTIHSMHCPQMVMWLLVSSLASVSWISLLDVRGLCNLDCFLCIK